MCVVGGEEEERKGKLGGRKGGTRLFILAANSVHPDGDLLI